MTALSDLAAGYGKFRTDVFPGSQDLYRDLVTRGQAPRVMIVGCCDSRVDPTTIFNARPGELFMVRNVANLVPPYEPHGDYHGTSAALEFAVTVLKVELVMVLGHAFCGGVRAYLDGLYGAGAPAGFTAKWISLLRPAMALMPGAGAGLDDAGRLRALERASVITSLGHLETFPFVKERVVDGTLALQGAHFDIETGLLWRYDAALGDFVRFGEDDIG